MGTKQNDFLSDFKVAFNKAFDEEVEWSGGQMLGNYACLNPIERLRRKGICKTSERFEMGDLRTTVKGKTLIIEYDGSGLSIQNLLKYWPYTRGELSKRPTQNVVLCHFSNWGSWGTHRDLWQWLMDRIQADDELQITFAGRQFDHGHNDLVVRHEAIAKAIAWIAQECDAR